MLQLAEREGLEVAEIRRESHSAKATGQRPVFNEIVDDIRRGKFNGILTWAPDRIARNAGDLGAIVDLMDPESCSLRSGRSARDFTNNPNEKFLLMILGSQAKLENDNRGVNVKRGMRSRCEMGLWPNFAPLGYLNQKMMDKKCQLVHGPAASARHPQMFEKVAQRKMERAEGVQLAEASTSTSIRGATRTSRSRESIARSRSRSITGCSSIREKR